MSKHPVVPREQWKDRRLGVVMFLDMVSYSAHMSRNEGHAMARVKHLSGLLEREVPEHGGKLIKFLGDGSMAEFPTAIAAVSCSLAVLEQIRERNGGVAPHERYDVRIGLHLGDLIEKDHDLFGDTVNVAARIQPFADHGGIAMSRTVYFSVRNQIPLRGAYLGATKLKNISERVTIFLVPPPDVPFVRWYIRRRNPINTRAKAIGLALAVAFLVVEGMWLANRPTGAPRAALLYVRPVATGRAKPDERTAMAAAIVDELNSRGGSFKELAWCDRGLVLGLLTREGVTDPTVADAIEPLTGRIAHDGKLAWVMAGQLEDTNVGGWRLKVKVVNGETQSVVTSFEAKGETASRLADQIADQMAAWLKTLAKPAKGKTRRR